MPTLITKPTRITAAGTPPKTIEEFIGRVNSGDENLSIARMTSPPGWSEPGQTPEFDEYSLVISGALRVEHRTGVIEAAAGQAVIARAGEWVRFSTPNGAEYISICRPAFAPNIVHRDE